MGKGFFIGFAVLSLFLFSCKKEESLEAGQGDDNKGSLLRRQVMSFGPEDSAVSTFGYDGNQRLISITTEGLIEAVSTTGTNVIQRNAEGIIQQIITPDDDVTGGSITSIVNYDPASRRYTSKIATYDLGGTTIKDSIAFTYNASGKIALEERFVDNGATGGYIQFSKRDFTYNGDNVTASATYQYNPSVGDFEQVSDEQFEYDDKATPINISTEAFLLGDASLSNANNITKWTYTNLIDPDLDNGATITYVYDAEGRPVSSSVLIETIGIPAPVTYTYQ